MGGFVLPAGMVVTGAITAPVSALYPCGLISVLVKALHAQFIRLARYYSGDARGVERPSGLS